MNFLGILIMNTAIKPEPKEDQQMRIQFFNIVTNKFCDLYMMLDGETGVVKHMQTAEIKV